MRPAWMFAFLLGCGGSPDTPVVELSVESQKNLCQHFVTDVCLTGNFTDFCASPCHQQSCAAAVSQGFVAMECESNADGDPITAEAVDRCATSGDAAVCLQGGGCMFDALEDACNGM